MEMPVISSKQHSKVLRSDGWIIIDHLVIQGDTTRDDQGAYHLPPATSTQVVSGSAPTSRSLGKHWHGRLAATQRTPRVRSSLAEADNSISEQSEKGEWIFPACDVWRLETDRFCKLRGKEDRI